MADSNVPVPQIDYTSRDYSAIKNDLVGLIDNFAPQWTSRDASDFGIVLIELFSYMGDMLSYYIDRAANEAFLSSATQRETVINIARLLNYTPSNVIPATGTVKFFNTSASAKDIPLGTIVATDTDQDGNRVFFETTEAVTGLAYNTQSSDINIVQGLTASQEEVGTSDGTPNQIMKISQPAVINDSTLKVSVANRTYNVVQHIVDYSPVDEVCSLITDGAGYTYVVFGNGVSGKIPPIGTTVYVTYRYGGGKLGNLGAGTITNLPNGPVGVEVTQESPTYGGADAESTDSIRLNAPAALRSVNRAVSLMDYANLAVQVSGVAKAIAAADVFTSVNLYIACSDGAPLSANTYIQTDLLNYFADKIPPNTTLNVTDFTPIYPVIHVEVTTRTGYDPTTVKTAVYNAIVNLFAFDNVSFNQTTTQADIQTAAGTYSIPGVQDLKITRMENQTTQADPGTSSGTMTSTTKLSYNVNELPILIADSILPNFLIVGDPS